jgi:hypothetical protein
MEGEQALRTHNAAGPLGDVNHVYVDDDIERFGCEIHFWTIYVEFSRFLNVFQSTFINVALNAVKDFEKRKTIDWLHLSRACSSASVGQKVLSG